MPRKTHCTKLSRRLFIRRQLWDLASRHVNRNQLFHVTHLLPLLLPPCLGNVAVLLRRRRKTQRRRKRIHPKESVDAHQRMPLPIKLRPLGNVEDGLQRQPRNHLLRLLPIDLNPCARPMVVSFRQNAMEETPRSPRAVPRVLHRVNPNPRLPKSNPKV